MQFGRVTNVLVLKGKNQAFLEMADEISATAMCSVFNTTPPSIRGRTVYVQFSNHRELKTDQNHSITVSILNTYWFYKLLTWSFKQFLKTPASGSPLPLVSTDPSSQLLATPQQNGTTGGANTVLRVIVESLLYPVTLEILHQIFQRFGKVLKIVTFTKNNSFQALIQYPDAQTAQHAKQTLDGQNIYNGCCTLRIDNSKLTALNVKYNNDKSRDFTNPTLPAGEPGSDLIASAGGLVNASDLLLLAAGQRPASLARDRLGNTCKWDMSFEYILELIIVNGIGGPGVLPPFTAIGLGTPTAINAYNGGIPSIGAFALTSTGALSSANPGALRGLSNVLLVSNLNEEVKYSNILKCIPFTKYIKNSKIQFFLH